MWFIISTTLFVVFILLGFSHSAWWFLGVFVVVVVFSSDIREWIRKQFRS